MRYIVVGGVAGGASFACRLRREDEKAEIVIYEKSGFAFTRKAVSFPTPTAASPISFPGPSRRKMTSSCKPRIRSPVGLSSRSTSIPK